MSDFWRGRSVFITGATGFLGGWLTERLVGLGAEVTCLLRNFHPCISLDGVEQIVFGDVRDQSVMERAIGERRCKTVFHLAAQAEVEVAVANPVSTWDTNVRGTWSVLEACRRCCCVEQIVVASTDKVYGEMAGEQGPFRESDPLNAIHPYDASKACADRIAKSYGDTWGLPVAIARLGNIFGGRDRTWSRLVPGTIRRLLNGQKPALRGDGNAVRDWLYVEDAVDGYLLLAEQMRVEAFNFSLGTRLPVRDVIDHVANALGLPKIRDYERVLSHVELQAQTIDSGLARRVLGWKPKHTFVQGLEKTVAWYKENL